MNKTCKKTIRLIKLTDIDEIVERLPKETADNAKRQLRKPLLTAYDSHKSTVIYEGNAESEEEHAKVVAWKKSALDLETKAFKDIPKSVQYYL